MSLLSLQVTLYRDGPNTPWGFRLVGGTDVGLHLTVQRVFFGSPAESEHGLRHGDVITRIGNKDATRMTHQQAHNAIKSAGNNLSVTVQRHGHRPLSSTSVSSSLGGAYYTLPKNLIINGSDYPRRFVPMPPQNFPAALNEDVSVEKAIERHCITNQPHRTFPLITPGVKVKHDVATGSYLRFVNDPFIQSRPEPSNMKTRVADAVVNAAWSAGSSPARSSTPEVVLGSAGPSAQVVNRQYNSPIHLYSPQNIVDTITGQTGVTPTLGDIIKGAILEIAAPADDHSILRKDGGIRIYDASKSPTYQALCEDEWQSTKKRTPSGGGGGGGRPQSDHQHHQVRTDQHKHPTNVTVVQSVQQHHQRPYQHRPYHPASDDYVNSLGVPKDKVLQSKSFDMLQTVLSHETDF